MGCQKAFTVYNYYSAATTILTRRQMSSSSPCRNLFIGGLSYDTNETILNEVFKKHGELIEVKVICDHRSGKSKGYGFVKFNSETAANEALKEMNGQFLDGRNIRVHCAHKG